MPQSIFEKKTYIGETIGSYTGGDWPKAPVWNWVEGGWIQLNAAIDKVDYSISHIEYNRALLTIFDHGNYDYLDFELLVTGPGVPGTPITLADDTQTFWIKGLTQNSTYTVNLKVNLFYGGQSNDSIQTFTTPLDPTPKAVTTLSSPARTNSWIDLAWTHPAGSSAVTYKVYQGYSGGSTQYVKTVTGTSTRIANLREDRKYRYFVRGVNSNNKEGPWSNELRWATGHGEIRRRGTDNNILFFPSEWGSFRNDIQWRWSTRYSGIVPRNPHVYQGYWPGNNWRGPSNPAQNPAAGNTRRYWGTITYSSSGIRGGLDRKHGSGVGSNISISSLKIKKIYRHRTPGIYSAVSMNWHLTNSNPFSTSVSPPVYGSYWGWSMSAGTYRLGYPLPASWGTALVRGRSGSTNINGLVLYRGDNQTNGYGAAGYGAWSGHRLRDPYYSGSWRESDLTLVLQGSWNFVIRSYKGPYRW